MIPLGILASSARVTLPDALLAPTNLVASLIGGLAKLTWTDNNTNETGHRIYRSSSPMDTQALPPPVAELGPDVTEWEDTDTPVGQETYYIVSAVRGAEEAFSDEVVIDTTLHPTIGEAFGGGYYAGDISYGGKHYHLIVSDVSADITGPDSRWKTSATSTPGTNNSDDGMANTMAMVAAGLEFHPGATHCVNYLGGGNNDWYMPANGESTVLYDNLGPNQPDCPERFKTGGDQAFSTANYFNSIESSASRAWFRNYATGNIANSNNKTTTTFRVRPIRRIEFTP